MGTASRSTERAVTDPSRRRVGDAEAFAELFRAHWSAVHAYARRRSADDGDAHDVAAETFTVAWRRFAELPDDHVLPWLYRTAANVLANRDRAARRRLRLVAKSASQPPPQLARVDDVVTDDLALAEAFTSLSPDQRELLRLVAWEGLSNDEIATVLDISSNAVASRVSRARARFEEALATADASAGHERDDRTRRTS